MTDWLTRVTGTPAAYVRLKLNTVTHVRATMASEYEPLAVQYLEMARGATPPTRG